MVTPDEQLVVDYEVPSDVPWDAPSGSMLVALANMTLGSRAGWDRNRAYLQVQVEGFVPMFARTTPLEDGIGHIQSLFGLGIAHDLFAVERRSGETPPKRDLWIHRDVGGKWEFQDSADLDHSIPRVLDNVAMSKAYAEMESDEQRAAQARRTLETISTVFSAGPLSARLLLASQWHLESFSGSDEMLSFVQAAVVLEILLGDKAASDLVGLGELLRNRCAYLISRNHAERELVLRLFRQIYDVRSKIVHAGKRRLDGEERRLFFLLRWICQRVIQEEVKLLSGKKR